MLVREAQKHLMHQRCGAKGVIAAFRPKLPRRQSPELIVDQREQLLGRLRAASAPRTQQFGQLLVGGPAHARKFRTWLAAQSKGPRSQVAGLNPSTQIISVMADAWRSRFASRYSGEFHQALAF